MKLIRYGQPGLEKPGMLDARGRIRDLSGIVPDLSGAALLPESIEKLRNLDGSSLPLVGSDARIGPCVGGVGKFICIGLNYSDHAAESGMPVPAEPILFMKATSAICGPNDGILIPRGSHKTDWEVELGVVIGKTARYVSEAEAVSHIVGYCVVNDLSERAFQLEGTGQWVKGDASHQNPDTTFPPWTMASPAWRSSKPR
jgi:2-keto-4-pentenoate hydratase/2-oxohepta-3-ene-1,7-dioic acid hydratase in catechol pathway